MNDDDYDPDPTNEFVIPRGNNDLSAYAMFTQRKYYSTQVYPNKFWAPSPFDLWYSRPLFGKVNLDGDPVFAPSTVLKQVESNVFVLDFVADAFNDFKTEFLFLNKNIVEGTPYALLTPSRGWDSALDLYDTYLDGVYDNFISFWEQTKNTHHLLDFDEFMDVFYNFINNMSPAIPITLGQFILSKFCPPTISGLMLDLSTDGHGNDIDKFNHFLNDESFLCFAESAQRFGFKVDKNYPGRLIADINSPVMNRNGDPLVAPSQGGMGYMLRYPQAPSTPKDFYAVQPTPPQRKVVPRPDEHPSVPFEVGDRISLAVVRGEKTNGFTYTILKDHTTLINRQSEPGYRAKRYKQKNVLNFLKNKVLASKTNGFFLPIYGHLISLSTNSNFQNISTSIFGASYTPPNEDVAIIDMKNLEGTLGTSPHGIWMGNDEKIYAVQADENVENIIDDGREYRFTTGFWPDHMYVEVPLSALHLKDDVTPFTIKRFKERVDYPTKLQKYTQQQQAEDKKYSTQQQHYENETLPQWNLEKSESEKEWAYFENPSNRLTLSNLFTRRFGRTSLAGVELLKEVCMQFYYSFAQVNPTSTQTSVVPCGHDSYITKSQIVKREKITKTLIKEKYPETYWIKQYILFCNAQSQNKYGINKLKLIRQRAMEIYHTKGTVSSITYVHKQMLPTQEVVSLPSTVFKK